MGFLDEPISEKDLSRINGLVARCKMAQHEFQHCKTSDHYQAYLELWEELKSDWNVLLDKTPYRGPKKA